VEGHGGITVELDAGQVSKVHLDILEGTRFYEALLKGRHYMEAATIVSRVCAICSASHAVTAQMAVEDAFGIEVSARTVQLRDLLLQGETIESHALHLFLLVLPDYLGYPSALDMARDYPDEAKMGLFLKQLGNRIQETVGGRAIHPPNVMVGRFGKIPGKEALRELLQAVNEGLKMVPAMVKLFAAVKIPAVVEQETTYLALKSSGGFGFVSRDIAASDGEHFAPEQFPSVCNERVVSHSHAKQSLYSDLPFAVGSQSRMVINGDQLTGAAARALETLTGAQGEMGLGNPLFNGLAQAVELVYSLETARGHLETLLAQGSGDPAAEPVIKPAAASGIGITEAPRGVLYHRYDFDADGRITDADIITPTAQNLANIERDMRLAAERFGRMSDDGETLSEEMGILAGRDLAFLLQVIARAYDPCISCSVH
jgi:sulfhydrogenase subunit alpha